MWWNCTTTRWFISIDSPMAITNPPRALHSGLFPTRHHSAVELTVICHDVGSNTGSVQDLCIQRDHWQWHVNTNTLLCCVNTFKHQTCTYYIYMWYSYYTCTGTVYRWDHWHLLHRDLRKKHYTLILVTATVLVLFARSTPRCHC